MPGVSVQYVWTDAIHVGYSQQPAVFNRVCVCESAAALGPQPSASCCSPKRLAKRLCSMLLDLLGACAGDLHCTHLMPDG